MKTTNKWIGIFASISLLTGVLTGCVGTSPESSTPGVSESSSVGAAQTRTYVDKAGREVEIPVNPQRIVTINMTAEAIALGVKPAGAAENWLTSLDETQKEGIESVGAVSNLNYEKILELEPELIITPMNVTNEDTIEALSKIAPTVVGPFFGNAIENLRTIGDVLGKSEEAESWISSYEEKAKNVKSKLSDEIPEGKTALLIQLSSKNATYIYPASTWPTIYEVLGLTLPDAAPLKELTAGANLSLDQLTEYNPDYIFLTSVNDASMPELKQQFTNHSVWNSLSAVKNNHVYTLGSRLSAGDVLTLDWALDEMVRVVEETNH